MLIRGRRSTNKALTIAGTGTILYFGLFFSLKQVQRACLAAGWTFAPGPQLTRRG